MDGNKKIVDLAKALYKVVGTLGFQTVRMGILLLGEFVGMEIFTKR